MAPRKKAKRSKLTRKQKVAYYVFRAALLSSLILYAHSKGAFVGPLGVWGPPVSCETELYQLCYMDGMEEECPADEVTPILNQAFDDVSEAFHVRFKSQVRVVIREEISEISLLSSNERPMGLDRGGATNNLPWKIVIQISKQNDTLETARHEIVHAMIYDQGIELPLAINEGLAYCFQSDDGWNWDHHETLTAYGPATNLGSPGEDGLTEEQKAVHYKQQLASGWAIVYYLVYVKGQSWNQVLYSSSYPSAEEAWGAIQVHRGVPVIRDGNN